MSWSSLLSAIYFFSAKKLNKLRINFIEELLGCDLHYFAPKKFEGSISDITKSLKLDRLESEFIGDDSTIDNTNNYELNEIRNRESSIE